MVAAACSFWCLVIEPINVYILSKLMMYWKIGWRRSNQSILMKLVLNIHWMDWCWSWNSNTLATWCKELTHWKRPLYWKRLKAGGEGGDRGWDGWMASLIQWTPGVGDGHGGLACWNSWGCKESDTSEWLNWTEVSHPLLFPSPTAFNLAVQGTLKHPLWHHSLKASILWHSAFFMVHLSHLNMTLGKPQLWMDRLCQRSDSAVSAF